MLKIEESNLKRLIQTTALEWFHYDPICFSYLYNLQNDVTLYMYSNNDSKKSGFQLFLH